MIVLALALDEEEGVLHADDVLFSCEEIRGPS